jgi:hypothetical protein
MRKFFLSIIHLHPVPLPSEGREIKDSLTRARKGFGCFLILLLLSSCATVDYLPPTQGTSAELQSLLAKSLEDNMKDIGFDPAGKAVDLRVRAIGGYQNSLGLERYVKSLFQEWIVGEGGRVGPGEFQMDVFLPVLGSSATRRDLTYQYIPLYYSERFRTTNQLMVVVRDGKGKLVGTWRARPAGDWTDMYLMRMIGPFDKP